MEEMKILKGEYEELKKSLEGKDLEELGIIELRRLRYEYEALHELNLDLQERVRFDRTKDTVEVYETLKLGEELWFNVGEELKPIMNVLRAKAAMAMERTKQRRELIENQTKNKVTLDSLKANLETTRSLLNMNQDEAAQSTYKTIIEGLEANVKALEELDKSYDARIKNLEEDIDILRHGGKLVELEELEKETTGLSEEEEKKLTKEVKETVEEVKEEAGLPGVSFEEKENELEGIVERGAIVGGEAELLNGLVNNNEAELATLPETEDDGLDPLPPRPERNEEELEPLPEKVEGEDDGLEPLPDRPLGVVAGVTGLADLPERPEVDLGEEEGDEYIDNDDIDLEEEEEEEEVDEETAVNATARQPKSKLWQKLQPVLEGVKVFLLGAIAIHTGIVANQPNNTNVVEETENATDYPVEETTVEEETAKTEETKTEEPKEEVKETEAKVTPTASESKPTTETKTDNNVVLEKGESVYNSETGVEVGYSGAAAVEKNNNVSAQEDRNLQKNDNNTVTVTQKDLQPDTPKVPTTEAKTGQEVNEEEARKNMTAQEQKNLDDATAGLDWEAFFNEGPTR